MKFIIDVPDPEVTNSTINATDKLFDFIDGSERSKEFLADAEQGQMSYRGMMIDLREEAGVVPDRGLSMLIWGVVLRMYPSRLFVGAAEE